MKKIDPKHVCVCVCADTANVIAFATTKDTRVCIDLSRVR